MKDEFTVIPLVVVNMATHLAVPVNDVTVIDDLILKRVLIGELEDVALGQVICQYTSVSKTVCDSSR
ncbi:hypothetical protein [Xanthomonas euvesicatoria]|uniref:hypothetical protein n=1 Tax=Xanthomonas euvesicatoria TaxID=456327 RepID=UPI0030C877E6